MLTACQKVGSPKLSWAIFLGDESTCNDLLGKLRAGTLHYDDFRTVQKATVSRYITKNGAQLVAFTDENDKVYLGNRENYDHWGHYLNSGARSRSLHSLVNRRRIFWHARRPTIKNTVTEAIAE